MHWLNSCIICQLWKLGTCATPHVVLKTSSLPFSIESTSINHTSFSQGVWFKDLVLYLLFSSLLVYLTYSSGLPWVILDSIVPSSVWIQTSIHTMFVHSSTLVPISLLVGYFTSRNDFQYLLLIQRVFLML